MEDSCITLCDLTIQLCRENENEFILYVGSGMVWPSAQHKQFARNALVGAVREWLSKNCCYLDIRERRSPDRWGDCRLKITVSWEIPSGATAAEDFEHDPDTGADPDPLRALLLAALAVADQKEQAK